MALVNCNECDSQISDRAAYCPKCGCPEPFSVKTICPECKCKIDTDLKSCPGCGFPLEIIKNEITEHIAYDIYLKDVGGMKTETLDAIKTVLHISSREAKKLVENTPSILKKGTSKEFASGFKTALEHLGATVYIQECCIDTNIIEVSQVELDLFKMFEIKLSLLQKTTLYTSFVANNFDDDRYEKSPKDCELNKKFCKFLIKKFEELNFDLDYIDYHGYSGLAWNQNNIFLLNPKSDANGKLSFGEIFVNFTEFFDLHLKFKDIQFESRKKRNFVMLRPKGLDFEKYEGEFISKDILIKDFLFSSREIKNDIVVTCRSATNISSYIYMNSDKFTEKFYHMIEKMGDWNISYTTY